MLFWTLIVLGLFLYMFIGKIFFNFICGIRDEDEFAVILAVAFWPIVLLFAIPIVIIESAFVLADRVKNL